MNDEAFFVAEPEKRDELLARISESVAGYPEVAFAYVFGSFLESYGFHDIDLGIYLNPGREYGKYRIVEGLQRELEKALCMVVDVRVLNEAPVSFVYHVLRGRLVYQGEPDLHTEVVELTIARYLDIQPLLKVATIEAFGR